MSFPKVVSIGRDVNCSKCLVIYLDEVPTDSEIQEFQEFLNEECGEYLPLAEWVTLMDQQARDLGLPDMTLDEAYTIFDEMVSSEKPK